jgi:hypothetical protein
VIGPAATTALINNLIYAPIILFLKEGIYSQFKKEVLGWQRLQIEDGRNDGKGFI